MRDLIPNKRTQHSIYDALCFIRAKYEIYIYKGCEIINDNIVILLDVNDSEDNGDDYDDDIGKKWTSHLGLLLQSYVKLPP